jgi:hypothetical protein
LLQCPEEHSPYTEPDRTYAQRQTLFNTHFNFIRPSNVVLRLRFLLFRFGAIYTLTRSSLTITVFMVPAHCPLFKKKAQRLKQSCQPSPLTTSNAWTNFRNYPHQNNKFTSVHVRKVFEVEPPRSPDLNPSYFVCGDT